ncbi:MAG: CBS domain-containing protein [Sedimentisphaerales bacterium]|nr:CBS domain-containing protein [Sedimentisphaerales bacterium]
MLKARDIMSTDVFSVKKDTPIFEAIMLLVERDISGLPVVEDDMTLVGILSEKDVVDLFYESEKAENKTVNDYMTDPAVHFDENSNLSNVCDFLIKNIFRRVPVTSDGRLVGIISVKDVLNSVLQLRQEKVGSAD